MYTCPMHPEIVSGDPHARCPKCGMALVAKKIAPKPTVISADTSLGVLTWKSYIPFFVIISVLILTAGILCYRDELVLGSCPITNAISYFMTGFFLTFATFKLIDLKGFAKGYSTYDLLAQKWFGYGYIYPFIELAFGFAMILMPFSQGLLWAEFAVMAFSGLGVAIKLAKREPFMCACLGTILKVPLTKVTLIEDFGMALLALCMIIIS